MIDSKGIMRDENGIYIPKYYVNGGSDFKAIYELKYIYVDKVNLQYYLYKIRVIGSQDFYIGVTENIIRRLSTHQSMIYTLYMQLKKGKEIGYKNPAHLAFAKTLLLKSKVILNDVQKIKNRILFDVLFKMSSYEEAKEKESDVLQGYFNNHHCLNTQFKSYYNPTWIKQKRIPILIRKDGLPILEDLNIKG